MVEITEKGIRCCDEEHELDIIIYATSFDAVFGSLKRIDIRGKGGQKLKEKGVNGPRTYLGMQSAGFPNLLPWLALTMAPRSVISLAASNKT